MKVQSCLKTCECPHDLHFNGACFGQGFVEFDYCTAYCTMTTFDYKFDCGNMDKDTCAHQCKIRDCEDHCLIDETKGGICGSNGLLYPSECALNCRAPSSKLRWKCKSPFSFKECGNKCAYAREVELGYHSKGKVVQIVKEVYEKEPEHEFVGTAKL